MRLAKAGLFRVIKSDLAVLEEKLREAAASPVPLIHEVGTHLVASGGKRLRPALFLLAARSGVPCRWRWQWSLSTWRRWCMTM